VFGRVHQNVAPGSGQSLLFMIVKDLFYVFFVLFACLNVCLCCFAVFMSVRSVVYKWHSNTIFVLTFDFVDSKKYMKGTDKKKLPKLLYHM